MKFESFEQPENKKDKIFKFEKPSSSIFKFSHKNELENRENYFDINDPDILTPDGCINKLLKPINLKNQKDFESNLKLITALEEYFFLNEDNRELMIKRFEEDRKYMFTFICEKLDKSENNYFLNEFLKKILNPSMSVKTYTDFSHDKEKIIYFNNLEKILKDKLNSEKEIDYYLIFLKSGLKLFFEEEFKVNLENFSTEEQIQFLNFLISSSFEQGNKLKKIVANLNANVLRTFLSVEHGGKEMGNKILALGEKLPKEVAEKVFSKYSEIIDSSNEISNILNERFGKEDQNQEVINQITESLLKKGKDLLLDSAKGLDKCTDEECVDIGKKVEEKLQFIKKENILLASTYKSLLKNENFKINEIKDVALDFINSNEEINKYKEELIRIFKENREDYPEELLKETLQEFQEALNNIENKEFYILKNKDEILAFMRFDILENGNYYAGSLNGRNEIQGLAVGGSFLKQLLIDKSKERSIEAVVYEKNQMLNRYANEFGFKIVGEIENYHNTGQKFFKLKIEKGSLQ